MLEYDKNVFATNLQRCMDINNTKQADICKLLNVSKSTVSSWCSAKKMPRMDKIEMLANHFGVMKSDLIEVKYLFDGGIFDDGKGSDVPAPPQKEKAPTSSAEALRIYAEGKKGGPLTQEELNRLDDFAETFIKGLNK